MQRDDCSDGDVLIYREPASPWWQLGLPLYTAALGFVVYGAVWIAQQLDEKPDLNPLLVLVLLGVGLFLFFLFAGVGWKWFGRWGVVVDRRKQRVTIERIFVIVPLKVRSVSLRKYHELHVHGVRTVMYRGSIPVGEWTDYYLDLRGSGNRALAIGRAASKEDLLDAAIAIGEHLDFEVVDDTCFPPQLCRLKSDRKAPIVDAIARALARKHGLDDLFDE